MASVLVVDDNYTMGIQTASIVEEAGYSVAGPEASVDAARKVLGRQKIDLALLELNLDGEMVFPIAEMLDAMRIPYIFVTSYSASAIPARYRHSPILQKPLFSRTVNSTDASVSRVTCHRGRPAPGEVAATTWE